MNRKASAVIISLWVLLALTVLVVSIGHRVSMALRLSRYQKDKLQASYLAKAGIARTIVEISKDGQSSGYDSLKDNWAENEEVFKEIIVDGDNKDNLASVSYTMEENNREVTVFGVTDEERKININTAPLNLLVELFTKIGAADPYEVSNNIYAWRGDAGVEVSKYQDLGYPNKSSNFSRIEELMLVKGIDEELYNSVKDKITIYGTGKININTVPQEVLEILVNFFVKQAAAAQQNFPSDLAERIINLRTQDIIFTSSFTDQLGLSPDEAAIINNLNLIDVKSTCFYIISNGKIGKSNFVHSIRAIFDRNNGKIVYRYES